MFDEGMIELGHDHKSWKKKNRKKFKSGKQGTWSWLWPLKIPEYLVLSLKNILKVLSAPGSCEMLEVSPPQPGVSTSHFRRERAQASVWLREGLKVASFHFLLFLGPSDRCLSLWQERGDKPKPWTCKGLWVPTCQQGFFQRPHFQRHLWQGASSVPEFPPLQCRDSSGILHSELCEGASELTAEST